VARIAYLTSDVVLSVQPSLQNDSLFSKSLKALKASKTSNLSSKSTEVSWD
jgi:sulfite reductase (NADPH) hemoprotein beta-component